MICLYSPEVKQQAVRDDKLPGSVALAKLHHLSVSSVIWDNSVNGLGFPGGASGKEPTCQCRRQKRCGSISRLGRSPGGRHSNPVQYSCLENPMNRGAWWGYSPWGGKELDMTKVTYHAHSVNGQVQRVF